MKNKLVAFLTLALLSTLNLQLSTAHGQATAFTYQGRLNNGTNIAHGNYDLTIALFSVSSGAGQLGTAITNSVTGVSNGLFTVAVDFGASFPGADRWLEIGVRSNGGGAFTTLAPRQKITPVPYAITASNLTGTVSAGGLSGNYSGAVTFNNAGNNFTGNGGGLTGLNASQLSGGTVPNGALSNAWKTTGNAGTEAGTHFLGTTDNQPLEIKVNGLRALRLEPNTNGAPNVIAGAAVNLVNNGIIGATIAGGGAVNYLGVALTNRVSESFGTVSGGLINTSSGAAATVGGGQQNTSSSSHATVGGGVLNTSSGQFAAVGGGQQNTSSGFWATVGGGALNNAAGDYSFAAGRRAKANHDGAFVWADSTDADFTSTGNGQFLVRASGGVGIGTSSPEADLHIRGNSTNGSLIITPNTSNSRSQVLLTENTTASLGFIMRYAGDEAGNPLQFIPLNSGAVEGAPIMTLERNGGFVGIGTNNPQSALHVIGTVTATAFNPPSDRHLKENFTGVSPRDVLDKVAGLTITRWNFKADAATPHLGPMAQDFHAAFGLGTDNKHIATVDADGVALAAIQGLNQKVVEQLERKEAEIIELKQRLDRIEKLLNVRSDGPSK